MHLAPGTHACVLLTSPARVTVGDAYYTHLPALIACPLRGLPMHEALFASDDPAIRRDNPVECHDIEQATTWAESWRAICRANSIHACHACAALAPDGAPVGWFLLCLPQVRHCTPWEQRVAEFGALAPSIVVERDRVAAALRNEVNALSRPQALSAELVGPGEFEPLLKKILAAADISGTEKGNIQIYDPAKNTLRIAVHQGLSAPGRAFRGRRLGRKLRRNRPAPGTPVVPDVEQLTDLQGTLGLEIVMADNIRSIQCILALSGWGQEEDRRASMEAGFNAHLVKPVDMDVLLEMLSTIEHRGISR